MRDGADTIRWARTIHAINGYWRGGFIGSNAAAYFASWLGGNVPRQLLARGGEANALWLGERKVEVIRLDLREAEATRAFFTATEFDAVLHCAAQVAVTTSVKDPRRDFEDNLLDVQLLEALRHSRRRPRPIYTSTNKVYGGMEDLVIELRQGRYQYRDAPFGISEERPLDFHSPYGCSKGGADQYVHDYSRIYGLPTLVYRQSCIYGERQFGVEDQGWVAWFTIAALLQQPLTVYGDGRQVRDVLYIKDLVRAFELGFESSLSGEIFNVGGGPGVSRTHRAA